MKNIRFRKAFSRGLAETLEERRVRPVGGRLAANSLGKGRLGKSLKGSIGKRAAYDSMVLDRDGTSRISSDLRYWSQVFQNLDHKYQEIISLIEAQGYTLSYLMVMTGEDTEFLKISGLEFAFTLEGDEGRWDECAENGDGFAFDLAVAVCGLLQGNLGGVVDVEVNSGTEFSVVFA